MKRKGFFHKQNIYQALWSLVIMFIGFLAGVWYQVASGPATVITQTSPTDPLIERTEDQIKLFLDFAREQKKLNDGVLAQQQELNSSNQRLFEVLDSINNSLITALESTSTAPEMENISIALNNFLEQQRRMDQIQSDREAAFRFDSEQIEASIATLANSLDESLSVRSGATISPAEHGVNFELPSTAKGYRPVRMRGIRRAKCPENELTIDATLEIKFFVADDTLPKRATPLLIDIVQLNVGDYDRLQVYNRGYPIKYGRNNILLDIDMTPGSYILRFGYFLWEELEEEYPHYYSKACEISIRE